ncbi:DC-STAMP domain-containing protein 2, partial [Porphyrio hochstetteri]
MGLISWLGKPLRRLKGQRKGKDGQQRKLLVKEEEEEESTARELARSAGSFVLGLTLASLYGAMVLLAQGHNIWYCLATTISLGAGLGLGMAFSTSARITVLLSLPHIFTREGKMLLLLLALGLAVQGPCTNILNNFSQVSESLACGAELALNQTAERLHQAQEPLLNVLRKVREISQRAKVVADHVRRFFRSIMDSVSHVARSLRNVWLWLASMGQVCNRELGTPYRRCISLFQEAKDNCERTIPFLFFLCYVIVPFKALCGVANIALVFCVIPEYIETLLRKRIAPPIRDALDRVRREFEFNISAVHQFHIGLNASKSLGEVALDIMEGVLAHVQPVHRTLELFTHISFLIILYIYFQALRYRYRYLRDDTFDNVYITRRFVELDLRRAEQGRPTALPLTARERTRYVPPGALWLTQREQRRYLFQLVGMVRHILLGFSIILADYSLFWLLDLIRHLLQGEIVARAPVIMGISVNGTGYASDIFRDLVSAFDVLQQGNVSVLSQRCTLQPLEPSYGTYITMGILYGICCFIAAFGGHMARLRQAVCAAFYPSREQERTCFLHSSILARRAGLVRALRQAALQRTADARQGNLLLFLSAKLPFLSCLFRLLGIRHRQCLACGTAEQPGFTPCITANCKASPSLPSWCQGCTAPSATKPWTNICPICMGPLSYRDTSDREMDSSDEETVGLWLGAARALRGQERGRLLRQRIREVVGGQGGGRRLPPKLAAPLRAQLKEEGSGESDWGADEDSSLSSLDFSYQEHPESSGSELEE